MGRIIPNENVFVGFAKTVIDKSAPKASEVVVGSGGSNTNIVDLTPLCMSLNASSSGNVVATPAFDTLFETSIVGTSTATFTGDFYRDDEEDLAWETLPRGTKGFFIISRFEPAPATGDKVEVWPVQVVSRAMANMANNTVQSFTLTCSVPDEPDEDAVIAA